MKQPVIPIILLAVALVGLLFISSYIKPSGWSEPIRITDGLNVNSVEWTPDGKIFFAANDSVWTVNPDGSNLKSLFNYNGVRRVAMSPDGQKVVLGDSFDIFVANIDGTDLRPVANDPNIFEFGASFSPDGSEIEYVTIDDVNLVYGLWIMATDGGQKQNLLSSGELVLRHPRFSPDGKRISYFTISKDDVYIISAIGRNTRQKIDLTSQDESPTRHASWSSSGLQIVYSAMKDGDFDIWLMNSDGTNKRQITDETGDAVKPAWSPDGGTIAFVCSGCEGLGSSDLYVISKFK